MPQSVWLPVSIRWSLELDYPAIVALDRASYADPWDGATLVGQLRPGGGRAALVAERDDVVVGYIVYALATGCVKLARLGVAPGRRRLGVGTQLVDHVKASLRPRRRARVVAVVRETSLEAQLFLRACGFRAGAVLRGHFRDTAEDAYRMQFALPTAVPVGVDDDCVGF